MTLCVALGAAVSPLDWLLGTRQAAYEAKTKKELLAVLAKHPEGVREGELQDAYPGAAKDLARCRVNRTLSSDSAMAAGPCCASSSQFVIVAELTYRQPRM